jgi:chemotaxis protein methyltransferase CheR
MRIIVVEVHNRVIGFIVDRVHEVLRISSSIVEPAPAMVCSIDSDFIAGVGKLEDRLLILLDLEKLFDATRTSTRLNPRRRRLIHPPHPVSGVRSTHGRSTTTNHAPTLTRPSSKRLSKIIYDRSGIHFPDNKKYVLESRLGHRLGELDIEDFDQYIAFLTMGPYQTEEFQEMFNRITINETSFFRNEPQLDVFEKTILPEMLEEAASDQAPPRLVRRLLHRRGALHARDAAAPLARRAARRLAHRDPRHRHQREVPQRRRLRRLHQLRRPLHPDLISRTATSSPGNITFTSTRPSISMVNFEKHNLKDTLAAKRHGTWDVIFCRNVMIYFDDDMKKRVDRYVRTTSSPTTAHCSSGTPRTSATLVRPFEPINEIPQGFCYRKRGGKPGKEQHHVHLRFRSRDPAGLSHRVRRTPRAARGRSCRAREHTPRPVPAQPDLPRVAHHQGQRLVPR